MLYDTNICVPIDQEGLPALCDALVIGFHLKSITVGVAQIDNNLINACVSSRMIEHRTVDERYAAALISQIGQMWVM